ncbi:AAA family ATPase [Alicyclobacillus macrosporangiidus]|uniref:MinD-like ATPase involved in chromosome partitioning or flagellar assembly n=1 Tax=Alicyclobacillus macrosporangiidus TaxID=392015 RepID=A0A1I7LBJ1_9BACL|nr:AAA family ATPase [Alicyclobacillus macrosporangiidus]SFV07018.1 MinD-like ATPase involved in chromosome partitioning or flagellar assembly [Alicyclobacillus macrosporangiidus]
MQIVLLDDSPSALERLQALAEYNPEHYRSILEVAGLHPDWVVVDEDQGPEVVRELQDEWGLNTCVVAKRVTLQLRRRFPRVRYMVSDAQLIDFFAEQAGTPEATSDESGTSQASTTESKETHSEANHIPGTGSVRKEASRPALSLGTLKRGATEESSAKAKSSVTAPKISTAVHATTESNASYSSRQALRKRNRRAHVIAVGPLRNTGGGAGKTAFVFNFAAYAAKKGLKVLVVDLDPNGVLGTLADASGELNVSHWQHLMLQNPDARMTERAVQDSVEYHPVFNFSLIAAAKRASVIPTELLSWIMTQTEPHYDLILVDTPSMWAEPIVTMMQEADRLVLVGLHDAAQYPHYKATLELLMSPTMNIGVPRERIHVIISRAYLGKNRDVEMEEISRQLDMPLSLIIPEDPRFYSYRENHKAIVLERQTSEYSRAVIPWFDAQLAELRGGSQNLPALVPAQKSGKNGGGFFARLFGGGKKTKAAHS